MAVTVEGTRDILGIGAGDGGEGAKYRLQVFAGLKNAAAERVGEFRDAWGKKYPAIIELWENAWAEFVRFLSFDVEIRTVICSTNAIESVNARIRKASTGSRKTSRRFRPRRLARRFTTRCPMAVQTSRRRLRPERGAGGGAVSAGRGVPGGWRTRRTGQR